MTSPTHPSVSAIEVPGLGMSRRDILGRAGKLGVAAAVLSPFALAQVASAQAALPQPVIDVLNYALTLEYLEASFYEQGLAAAGLIPDDARETFETIEAHEQAHVEFLQSALGDKAVAEPQFDFTAGGTFDTYETYDTFLLLSQALEDTGVRAYKGQAGALVGQPEILTAALTIHSVEARHAAQVRSIRDLQPWIPQDQPDAPAPVAPVYAGEGTTTVIGLDVTTVSDVAPLQITESFDEPLTMKEVLAIAGPFIAG